MLDDTGDKKILTASPWITGQDHQDARILCGWRRSKIWNPMTSPWMKQLMWLRIVHSGDWCLCLVDALLVVHARKEYWICSHPKAAQRYVTSTDNMFTFNSFLFHCDWPLTDIGGCIKHTDDQQLLAGVLHYCQTMVRQIIVWLQTRQHKNSCLVITMNTRQICHKFHDVQLEVGNSCNSDPHWPIRSRLN